MATRGVGGPARDEDAIDFLVMEYLEGETLARRLAREPLAMPEAVQHALTLLATLKVLHQRGLVHRDLKPANLFLTPHGLKLLDFGIARSIQRDLGETNLAVTMPGGLVGTPQYMAPEALQGQAIDARADLFGVGVVLYEMLAAKPAFSGDSVIEVAHAVIHNAPPVLTGSRAVIAIDRVINRALAKRPEDRYQAVEGLAEDLRRVELRSAEASEAARPVTRLIVLPFRMLRPDPDTEFLAFSLPDAITSSLSGLQSLLVRSSLAAGQHAGATPDLKALAREAEVDLVLVGTLLRAGDQLRVKTQLLEVPSGTVVWSQNSQVGLQDLFQLEDELTRRLVDFLSLPLTAREHQLLSRDVPASATAYQHYLRANQLSQRPSDWPLARDLYQRCVEQDPSYAPAWARLGRMHRVLAKYTGEGEKDGYARAETALRRALELNPDLPVAHDLYTGLEVDQGRAKEAMLRLIGRAKTGGADPNLFTGLVHACRYCGLLEASIAAHERARRLDPRIETSVENSLWMVGQYQQAIDAAADKALSVFTRALSLLGLGRQAEAILVLDAAIQNPDFQNFSISFKHALRALRGLAQGNREAALAALEQVDFDDVQTDSEATYFIGSWFAPLGNGERALSLIEQAIRQGFFCYPWIVRDPSLDPLRTTPQFQQLLQQVEARYRDALAAFTEAGGHEVLGLPVS